MSRKNYEKRRATRRLFVESLESRRVLAGNVSAALSGYHLLITGDNLANDIDISAHATIPGRVVITPTAGTTLNNLTIPLTFPAFGDIRITMNGGDDIVDFLGDAAGFTDSLPGSLVVNNGEGNNTFTLSDYNIGNAVTITNGNGIDTTILTNNNITRDVTIYNGNATGAGRQTTTIETDNTIGGSLRINNLNGDNDIFISGEGPIAIGRDLSISNSGAGLTDDVIIEIENTNIGNNLTIVNRPVADIFIADSTVTHSAAIRNGNGNNSVEITAGVTLGTTTTDRFSIFNGIGDQTVILDALTVNGYSDIRSTAGGVDITINNNSSFLGSLSINNGLNGVHTLNLVDLNVQNDLNIFSANGTQNDTNLLGTTTVGGKTTIRHGNSVTGNTMTIESGALTGLITLINGTGDSTVTIGAGGPVTAGAGVSILNGNGDASTVTIDDATITGALSIRNGNNIATGHNINIGATTGVSVSGNASIFTYAGDATVIIDEVSVGGNFYLYTNSGADTITLADDGAGLSVTGTTYVDSGAGADNIFLGNGTATATFLGTLIVRAGLGSDNVTIGANVDNSVGTAIASGLFLFDGGTDPVGSNIITVTAAVIDPFADPLTFSKFRNFIVVTV